MARAKESPLFFHRYELKYHIPIELVPEIERYIAAYCEKDYFSEQAPGGYYTVNNLYLDSPNLSLLHSRLNKEDRRFNLRARCYTENFSPPYFLEVKYKQNGKVKKYRADLDAGQWEEFSDNFNRYEYPFLSREKTDVGENFIKFESLAHSLLAETKVQTRYQRLAYFSVYDDYARVTFDKNLVFREQDELIFKKGDFSNYDHGLVFNPFTNVIMELKCTTQVPSWFLDLIRTFQLEKSSFSKYVGAVLDLYPSTNSNHDHERVANSF
ncbi:MAG: polyphosphate polymerase domain-containing protein [Bacteriovoracaceae bacterium]